MTTTTPQHNDTEHFSELEWRHDHPEGDTYCYSEYCHSNGECSTGRELS